MRAALDSKELSQKREAYELPEAEHSRAREPQGKPRQYTQLLSVVIPLQEMLPGLCAALLLVVPDPLGSCSHL